MLKWTVINRRCDAVVAAHHKTVVWEMLFPYVQWCRINTPCTVAVQTYISTISIINIYSVFINKMSEVSFNRCFRL